MTFIFFIRETIKRVLVIIPIIYQISDDDWAVFVELSNGKIYGCDFVVSATGVTPNTKLLDGKENNPEILNEN